MTLSMTLKPGESLVIDGHTSIKITQGNVRLSIATLDGVHRKIDRLSPDGTKHHSSKTGDQKR